MARCFRNGLLVIATVVMVTIQVCAQRTYMRSCECEYTENGKCAYTLLLPLTQNENDAVCPKNGEHSESAAESPELKNKLSELQEVLSELSENITSLGLWSGDQSRMLSQLQSKVMEQTDRLDELVKNRDVEKNTTMTMPSDECEICPELELQLQQQSDTILDISQEVDKLSTNITYLQLQFEELQSNTSQVQSAMSNIESINQTVSNMHKNFSEALDSLNTKLLSSHLCMQKGLLVSGNSSRINDEAISASSEVANGTAGMVRIASHDDTSGWCPQEEPNQDEEWIQFDLGTSRVLYGVVTKGRADYAQWVTSYKIQYGLDNAEELTTFKDIVGDDEIFTGNDDQNTARTNMFWQPIRARYIRFVPLSSYASRNKCLRADVIGCLDA